MSSAMMVAMTAIVFVVAGGCGTLAGAPASPTTSAPSAAQRRECERNGGSWSVSAGFCRVGQ